MGVDAGPRVSTSTCETSAGLPLPARRGIDRLMRRFLAFVVVLGSVRAGAAPLITEVAWAGFDSGRTNEEWVEVFNPGPDAICDLSAFAIVQGATERRLPALPLAANEVMLLQRVANAPIAGAVTFSLGGGLTDGGQVLKLCPFGDAASAACDVANPGGAWFAGDKNASPRTTQERTGLTDGGVVASWQAGTPSSPGIVSFAGAVGDLSACAAPGEGEGEGEGEFPDAGPNAEPEATVQAPASAVVAADGEGGPGFDLTYSVDDADGDDVSVDVFIAADGEGNDGIRVARGLPGGSSITRRVTVGGVPAGTWHIFIAARDARGGVGYAYAPGTVAIASGTVVDASFRLVEPDGVDDVDDRGTVLVTWEATIPAGQTASIALFLDTNGDGAGGIPLVGGLPAVGDEGQEVGRIFALDTTTLAPGPYRVYGVLTHAGPDLVSVADGTIVVEAAEGCGSVGGGGGAGVPRSLPGLLVLAMLAAFGMLARRHIGVRTSRDGESAAAVHGRKA
jgi:hypothetical protein